MREEKLSKIAKRQFSYYKPARGIRRRCNTGSKGLFFLLRFQPLLMALFFGRLFLTVELFLPLGLLLHPGKGGNFVRGAGLRQLCLA